MNNNSTVKRIREDVRFWIFVGTLIVIPLMWGLRLEGKVNAMEDKYETEIVEMAADIKLIKENQYLIVLELGLKPVR